jgi:hypothetical protein
MLATGAGRSAVSPRVRPCSSSFSAPGQSCLQACACTPGYCDDSVAETEGSCRGPWFRYAVPVPECSCTWRCYSGSTVVLLSRGLEGTQSWIFTVFVAFECAVLRRRCACHGDRGATTRNREPSRQRCTKTEVVSPCQTCYLGYVWYSARVPAYLSYLLISWSNSLWIRAVTLEERLWYKNYLLW